jgi:hypothetical protein
MALPVTPIDAGTAYQGMRVGTSNLMSSAANLAAQITAGTIDPLVVISVFSQAIAILQQLAVIQGNPAIEAAVTLLYQQQVGDATLAVATEIAASAAALQALVAAIQKDFPVAADGTHQTLSATAGVQNASFTGAQFPTTAPAISAWLATVS